MDNLFPLEVIDSIMAEHVFEHLNTIDTIYALKLLTKYLKKYGYIRIAVPDWNINYFNETEQNSTYVNCSYRKRNYQSRIKQNQL